ncbi:MAG: glycosyltransferase family 4 protein [Candidatus Thermoplasmatota archaeon]
MKITFVVNGYASDTSATSGGELHCRKLIEHFGATTNPTSICCDRNYKKYVNIRNVAYSTYPPLPFERRFYNLFPVLFFIYLYRAIASIFVVRKMRSDVLVSNSHFFHDIIPVFFACRNGTQPFTFLHHIIGEQKRGSFSSKVVTALERMSFYMIKKKDFIVFTDSDHNKAVLVGRYSFKERNIYVIKNGLDLGHITRIRAKGSPTFDISFIGRLNVTKGIYDVIDILKYAKQSVPSIRCAIIGEGKESSSIESLIRKNNLAGNISLLGFLGEDEKIATLKSSKLFILPSHEEGWGIVIGEAMACGVPVVAYGLEDIVGIWGDNITWVPCFDTMEFSRKVVELLVDEDTRRSFVRRGLAFARGLDWNAILLRESGIITERYHSKNSNGQSVQ